MAARRSRYHEGVDRRRQVQSSTGSHATCIRIFALTLKLSRLKLVFLPQPQTAKQRSKKAGDEAQNVLVLRSDIRDKSRLQSTVYKVREEEPEISKRNTAMVGRRFLSLETNMTPDFSSQVCISVRPQMMHLEKGELPVGLLTGTGLQYGNFDECLDVQQPLTSQYCLVTLELDVPPGYDTLDPETERYPPTLSAWYKIHFGKSRAKQRLDNMKMALLGMGPPHISDNLNTESSCSIAVREVQGEQRLDNMMALLGMGPPHISDNLNTGSFCSIAVREV
ncbi:hypothetical protein J6590_006376 [Homalodisca vitripennis]|nr:hypothetical protein J6590_006376 [Homalodisca vitripennis]